MPAGLGALHDHEVAATLDRRHGVPHLPAHAGDEHAGLVQPADDVARHPESGNEQRRAAGDDQLDAAGEALGQGREQVDAERLVGRLVDRVDLALHELEGERCGAERADAAGVRHRGHELVIGDAAHAREHHRMLDLQQLGQPGLHDPAPYR